MQVTPITHTENLERVETGGAVRISDRHGETCECGCSDGHWITILAPEKDGAVVGVMLEFDDYAELDNCIGLLRQALLGAE